MFVLQGSDASKKAAELGGATASAKGFGTQHLGATSPSTIGKTIGKPLEKPLENGGLMGFNGI